MTEDTRHNKLLYEWQLPIDAEEPIIDELRRIIDPHHHLWDIEDPLSANPTSGRPDLRWQTRYLIDDITKDINNSGHNVVKTVFIEACAFYEGTNLALAPLNETVRVQKIHDNNRGKTEVAAGIVGFVDLSLDTATVKHALEAHMQAAPNLKGVRFANSFDLNVSQPHNLMVDADPNSLLNNPEILQKCILLEPLVRDNIRLVASYGLSLDLWSHHNHLPQIIDTVKAIPSCTFILDHIGGPLRGRGKWSDLRKETETQWRADIAELAKLPNVFVKVGGAGMTSMGFPNNESVWPRGDKPPNSKEVAIAVFPWFKHVITSFGTDRCMFESNFPVCKASFSYKVYWNACKRIADRLNLSEKEKDDIFSGTAERVYRLNDVSSTAGKL